MAGYGEFMDLDFVWVHKHAEKELGQYPAILTFRLVNNPYVKVRAAVEAYGLVKRRKVHLFLRVHFFG